MEPSVRSPVEKHHWQISLLILCKVLSAPCYVFRCKDRCAVPNLVICACASSAFHGAQVETVLLVFIAQKREFEPAVASKQDDTNSLAR